MDKTINIILENIAPSANNLAQEEAADRIRRQEEVATKQHAAEQTEPRKDEEKIHEKQHKEKKYYACFLKNKEKKKSAQEGKSENERLSGRLFAAQMLQMQTETIKNTNNPEETQEELSLPNNEDSNKTEAPPILNMNI